MTTRSSASQSRSFARDAWKKKKKRKTGCLFFCTLRFYFVFFSGYLHISATISRIPLIIIRSFASQSRSFARDTRKKKKKKPDIPYFLYIMTVFYIFLRILAHFCDCLSNSTDNNSFFHVPKLKSRGVIAEIEEEEKKDLNVPPFCLPVCVCLLRLFFIFFPKHLQITAINSRIPPIIIYSSASREVCQSFTRRRRRRRKGRLDVPRDRPTRLVVEINECIVRNRVNGMRYDERDRISAGCPAREIDYAYAAGTTKGYGRGAQ